MGDVEWVTEELVPVCRCDYPAFDHPDGTPWSDVVRGSDPVSVECVTCGGTELLYRPVDERRGFVVRGLVASMLSLQESGVAKFPILDGVDDGGGFSV